MRRSALALVLVLAASAAHATDVWEVYPFEAGGGTIAALPAADLESPEPHWSLAMTCRRGADWDMAVAGVDAAALGAAITSGAEVQFAIIADGDENNTPAYGYYPRIAFDQMFGEWGYSTPFGMQQIDDIAAARSLEVKGTGVAFPLPPTGTAEAFAEFRALCAALPQDDQ